MVTNSFFLLVATIIQSLQDIQQKNKEKICSLVKGEKVNGAAFVKLFGDFDNFDNEFDVKTLIRERAAIRRAFEKY